MICSPALDWQTTHNKVNEHTDFWLWPVVYPKTKTKLNRTIAIRLWSIGGRRARTRHSARGTRLSAYEYTHIGACIQHTLRSFFPLQQIKLTPMQANTHTHKHARIVNCTKENILTVFFCFFSFTFLPFLYVYICISVGDFFLFLLSMV